MSDQDDSAYYASRAAAARVAAERARDPVAQVIHNRMAARYDELAADPAARGAMAEGAESRFASMPNAAA